MSGPYATRQITKKKEKERERKKKNKECAKNECDELVGTYEVWKRSRESWGHFSLGLNIPESPITHRNMLRTSAKFSHIYFCNDFGLCRVDKNAPLI